MTKNTTSSISIRSRATRKAMASVLAVGVVMTVIALNVDNGARHLTASNQEQCQQLLNASEDLSATQQCEKVAQTNELTWGTWFSGKSRSTQFHFLDLFELLFGGAEHQNSDYSSDKKVRLG